MFEQEEHQEGALHYLLANVLAFNRLTTPKSRKSFDKKNDEVCRKSAKVIYHAENVNC